MCTRGVVVRARAPRAVRSGPSPEPLRHPQRAGPADRTGGSGDDVRLRDHAVRRHPHGARGDVRRLRPPQPRPGATPATTCTTCRTSPTSTTRCSSGRSATGVDWRELAEPETAAVPRGHGGAAGAAAASTTSGRRVDPAHRVARDRAAPQTGRSSRSHDVETRRPRTSTWTWPTRRLRRGQRAGPRPRCWRSSPSAAATPTGPASATRSTPLLWRAARPGEPSWDTRARRGPARLAHRVHGDRAGPPRHGASTSRAAAATSSSRTTRCARAAGQVVDRRHDGPFAQALRARRRWSATRATR